MNKICTLVLALTLLAGSAFAAFIRTPIPPSTKDNYLLDGDGDGRLDGISMKLLGSVSQDYLDQLVDSLTFEWIDSSDNWTRVVVPKSAFKVDPSSDRSVFVDLSGMQQGFQQLTALRSPSYSKTQLGNVKWFMSDGTVYNVVVKDKMAPTIKDAVLSNYGGKQADTLSLRFSESIKKSADCVAFLSYKSVGEKEEHPLRSPMILWSRSATMAQIILDDIQNFENRLSFKDSIRLLQNCAGDSLKNWAMDDSKFIAVAGYFPMEIISTSMVYDNQEFVENTPMFQLRFENEDVEVPNEYAWGFAMDVMNEEFLNAVRSTLSLPSKATLDYSKLTVQYKVSIFTNSGLFVADTSTEVKGDDPQFEDGGKRLFLMWNALDAHHRRVGTGVYIADIVVHVMYDNRTIYRNDIHHGPTTRLFGVKRR